MLKIKLLRFIKLGYEEKLIKNEFRRLADIDDAVKKVLEVFEEEIM
ncbi:MAG: hypothetical protein LWW95_11615 [Candidatus Desulfofervidus auxilii]|nr:hypothetical protein [Candidatus Desulfofervidus auxilii]